MGRGPSRAPRLAAAGRRKADPFPRGSAPLDEHLTLILCTVMELTIGTRVLTAAASPRAESSVAEFASDSTAKSPSVVAIARMIVAPGIFSSMTPEQRRVVFSSDAGETSGSDDEI